MNTASTVPLDGLAERIAQQQSELEALLKELANRQARVARLQQKKEDLGQRLLQLDAEIQAVSQGKKPKRRPGKARRAKAAVTTSLDVAAPPKKMADLLVDILAKANGPLTAKQLAEDLQGQGLFMTSENLSKIVQARLYELVTQGVLKRSKDQPGVVLARARRGSKAAASKNGRKKKARKKRAAAKASPGVGANGKEKAPLRTIVTEIMANSDRPLPARDLAEMALAAGYSTKSKNLTNVMWVMLGQMDNVENVKGEGYRLKK